MKTNEERLQKIISNIKNEKQAILKSKEKIKDLNKQKKQIELKIAKEKNAELCKYLSECGIKTVKDFQDFIDDNTKNTPEESDNTKDENY